MTEKEVWVVWSNTDLTEGRGRQYALYYCEAKSTALRLGARRDVQGSDCRITKEIMFEHNGVVYTPGAIIQKPSKQDELVEAKRKQVEQAVLKAVKLGLSQDEINAMLEFKD